MDSTSTRSDRRPRGARVPLRLAALLGCATIAIAATTHLPARADDPLAPYRERFQQGLDRYRAGDVQAAIQYWEPIRRELGDERGYRLLFNLGKAYETLGDTTRAAERYEAFLTFADKVASESTLDPQVQDNVKEARARVQELMRTRGRIRVLPSDRPGLVQVDLDEPRLGAFKAFVAPGQHTVTIDRGTASQRIIEVNLAAGEEVVVDPTRPPVPAPSASAASSAPPPSTTPPAPRPTLTTTPQKPFSPYVIVAASGATVLSLALPWLVWRKAKRLSDRYDDASTSPQDRREIYNDYDRTKTTYAWSWGVPAVLAATTGALTVWYLEGGKQVSAEAGPSPQGAWLGLHGTF
jgi:tetratricopeptide (TPR) repeat protein